MSSDLLKLLFARVLIVVINDEAHFLLLVMLVIISTSTYTSKGVFPSISSLVQFRIQMYRWLVIMSSLSIAPYTAIYLHILILNWKELALLNRPCLSLRLQSDILLDHGIVPVQSLFESFHSSLHLLERCTEVYIHKPLKLVIHVFILNFLNSLS